MDVSRQRTRPVVDRQGYLGDEVERQSGYGGAGLIIAFKQSTEFPLLHGRHNTACEQGVAADNADLFNRPGRSDEYIDFNRAGDAQLSCDSRVFRVDAESDASHRLSHWNPDTPVPICVGGDSAGECQADNQNAEKRTHDRR
jgi:hypothetical protein